MLLLILIFYTDPLSSFLNLAKSQATIKQTNKLLTPQT